MKPVYLIGGGWKSETFPETYGRFLESAAKNKKRRIAIIVAEENGADSHEQFLRFRAAFESTGLKSADASEIVVSKKNLLTAEQLAEIQPTGIFVCGGLTPAYYDALCVEKSWLDYLSENNVSYCGFSAGASIAAEKAIVGGWRRDVENKIIEIADENAGEDLDLLDVREGLNLVPFAVDVHAAQWGTLSRLVHTIDAKFINEGWAIDENTMLEFDEKQIRIFGAGNAYRAKRENNGIKLDIFQAISK